MRDRDYYNLADRIFKEVSTLVGNEHNPVVIGIDGFYGAGKSTLAKFLGNALRNNNTRSLLLETDDFMKFSRKERMAFQDRYLDHTGWYNLDEIRNTIKKIKQSESSTIELSNLYDHKTGELDKKKVLSLEQGFQFMILEGMYAIHPRFADLINYKIVLIGDHSDLQQRVLRRDHLDRGIEPQVVLARYEIINGDVFKGYLRSVLHECNIVFDTSKSIICKNTTYSSILSE